MSVAELERQLATILRISPNNIKNLIRDNPKFILKHSDQAAHVYQLICEPPESSELMTNSKKCIKPTEQERAKSNGRAKSVPRSISNGRAKSVGHFPK